MCMEEMIMTNKEINDLQEYIYNLIQNRRNIGQEPTCDDLFAVLGHLEILKESPTPLPSGVDEAAEEWFHYVKYKSDLSCAPINAFKAGAEWMANQGETKELTVESPIIGQPMICCPVHGNVGDKVIVQIRKV